jgi:hypothetical protein
MVDFGHPYYNRAGDPITRGEAANEFSKDRQIADTYWKGIRISTVFLVLNHDIFGSEPLIFETMVFVNIKCQLGSARELSQYCWRYATEELAKAGHEAVVTHVRRCRRRAAQYARYRRYLRRRRVAGGHS